VSTLRTKLGRDLLQLRGPIITISLVVACGIAAFVTMRGTWHSLLLARDTYYSRYNFGEVFARAHRVPDSVEASLLEVPGVESIYTRVVTGVRLPMPDMDAPAIGYVVSVPDDGRPPLHGLRITAGRDVAPGHLDEVLVLESFARAHDLEPGETIPIVIEGAMRRFRVVGFANSPEFVFSLPPGEIMAPDDRRFAVVWMSRAAAGPASDMDGAFNDLVATMQPGASEPAVLAEIDRLLEPYGGVGATGRDRQPSHYFLDQELAQLENLATWAPVLFLAVAAFLLNVVLGRFVQLQRGEIATLKALGYSDRTVGTYYLELASVIVLFGAALGMGLGAVLGRGMMTLYAEFFRLPALEFRLTARVAAAAAGISLAAGVLGALVTVRSVVSLPPAEAMRPAAPASYRSGRLGAALASPLATLFGPSVRMVIREVSRRPARLLLSVAGVALAVGILVMGRSFMDAMTYLVDDYMPSTQREDVTVTFDLPRQPRSLGELDAIPGVLRAEGMRALPARFRAGHHEREAVAYGHPEGLTLRVVRDTDGRRMELPPRGAIVTKTLAEVLHVGEGDTIILEPLEGDRRPRRMRIAGLVDEMFGMQAYMRIEELHRILGETPSVGTAMLAVDADASAGVLQRLRDFPMVAGAVRLDETIKHFRDQSARSTEVTSTILTLFAITIVIGVVYNNARIALSMRSRELASLRVLGFTRGEIAAILVLEIALQIALAIPIGWALGYFMTDAMLGATDQEIFRLAPIVSSKTYAIATIITLAAGVASAFFVRRKLDRLDLVGVLKTRE
jgi:putative ABC transport system permease protein